MGGASFELQRFSLSACVIEQGDDPHPQPQRDQGELIKGNISPCSLDLHEPLHREARCAAERLDRHVALLPQSPQIAGEEFGSFHGFRRVHLGFPFQLDRDVPFAAASIKRACKAALDKAGIETLGGPKLMTVARANGTLGPVDYNTMVCSAAIDGFAVTTKTSWFGSPSITIGPARGGASATMKLRKTTREGGAEVWAIGDLEGKAPLTTASDIAGCLATTLDRNDPTPIVRSLGFATGAVVTFADLFGGSGMTTFQCRDAKLRWLEAAQ